MGKEKESPFQQL